MTDTDSFSNFHNKLTKLINNDSVKEFTTYLSNENWELELGSHNT
jgi:hypothetical protein